MIRFSVAGDVDKMKSDIEEYLLKLPPNRVFAPIQNYSITNDMVNMNDFIKHIKNDQPPWYTPGKYIPKILFTNMFNERYGEEKTSRNVMNLLKKSGHKNKIILDEKNCHMSISTHLPNKKVYNCFLARRL